MTTERKSRICAVAVSREYGGPEEGGWWYDLATKLRLRRARGKKRNRRIAREMRRDFGHLDDGRDLGSVLSLGRVRIQKFDLAYVREFILPPPVRPHYE